jgi:hypothetical protein
MSEKIKELLLYFVILLLYMITVVPPVDDLSVCTMCVVNAYNYRIAEIVRARRIVP